MQQVEQRLKSLQVRAISRRAEGQSSTVPVSAVCDSTHTNRKSADSRVVHRGSRFASSRFGRITTGFEVWKSAKSASSILLVLLVAFTTPDSATASPYSLGIVSDSACNGLTTWAQGDCKIFAGEDIPAFTIGLFDSSGSTCCGEAQVSVQAMVSKSSVAVSTTGYLDRDSEIGDTMQVQFSGIRVSGTEAGSGFAITFTAFYNGYYLTYVTPSFSVMPNGIELESPWGSWGDYVEFEDEGPWQVHEELPTFSVALTSRNTTATSIAATDGFYIGARLFDKTTLADISATSLSGTTRKLVVDGKASFPGLSVGFVAGTGFRVSFFLEGSDQPCLPSILRAVCDQWEAQRGLTGGLGGYQTETMSGNITIYPDLLSLTISGRHPGILRVDETMFTYTVQFFDSQAAGAALTGFVPSDGFSVTASLFNGNGVDISSWGLEGTKTVSPSGASAQFGDLVVKGTAGAAFRLEFSSSWHARCVLKLVDAGCSGRCCVKTADFFVYPYSIQLTPSVFSGVTEGATLPNVTVSFRDYAGSLLAGISSGDSFEITPYLRKRGRIISLQGEQTVTVDGGVARFSGLAVEEEAGSLFTLLFQEDSSQMSAVSAQFSVFGSALRLDSAAQRTIQAGQPVQDLSVRVLGSDNQTLSSIAASDGFAVTVRALKWDGTTFVDCACIEGHDTATVSSGVASVAGSNLTVRSTIGRFRLEARQDRTGGLSSLAVESAAFSVVPASMTLTTAGFQSAYSTGQTLSAVDISFSDVDGGAIADIQTADAVVVSASLLYAGAPVSGSSVLSGGTQQTVSGGVASFSGLEVNGAAGSGYQVMFTFVDSAEGSVLTANSTSFSLRPSQLSVNDSRPDAVTNERLPPMFVSLDDGAGGRLVEIAAADAFVVSASLVAGTVLGCLPPDLAGVSAYAMGLNASDCLAAAAAAHASAVMTGFGSPGNQPLCAFDFAGADPEGDCGVHPCWLPAAVSPWTNASRCGVDGVCCGAECHCDPAGSAYTNRSEMAVYGLVNRTDKLVGTKSVLVSAGRALFADLRVTHMFGREAFWLRFTDNGDLLSRNTSTSAFSVGPPRLVLRGLSFASTLLATPLPRINVTLADLNGRALTPMPYTSGLPFSSEPYAVSVSASHSSSGVEVAVPLLGQTTRAVEGATANVSGVRVDGTAGSGFRLTVAMDRVVGSVSVTSRNFTVFPDQLVLPSGPLLLSNLSDQVMPAVTVECQTADGTLLSALTAADALTVHVDVIDRNGTVLGVCASSSDTKCVAGTVDVTVVGGIVTFDAVVIQGTAGTGFVYRYSMAGGGPSVDSASFAVFPGEMVIAEGLSDFFGQYWVMNRGVGDYAIRLQSPSTGAHSTGVTTTDGFNISVTLTDTESGLDVSGQLQGQRWVLADYDSGRGVHAVFTDLVTAYAGAGLQLRFQFADASSSLEVATSLFRSVPYSLRIAQRCHNGNAINTSGTVPFGVPQLACVGTDPDAPSDFGVFGFLTGYYYYVDNQFVGPLLRTVQGQARVPTMEVTATDLYEAQQTDVTASDGMVIQAHLYKDAEDFSSVLGGTRLVTLDGGAATFSDLTVGNVTGCGASCDILLRFSLVGALCQDTWCTNVSLSLAEPPLTSPQNLGSHPAFPGTQTVNGVAVVPSLDALSSAEQTLFRSAVVAFSGVPLLSSADVSVLAAVNASSSSSSRRLLALSDLEVSFSVAAKTFTQASAIYAGLTTFLSSGSAVFTQVCSASERASLTLCNKTVTLKQPLTREVTSLLLSSRVPTPTFDPEGSSSTCVSSSSCVAANFSAPFGSFSVTISTEAGSTVLYTMDTCPTPTTACTATGSVLSSSSNNVSSGVPIAVVSSAPTATILPVGLTAEDAVGGAGAAFGAAGVRHVGVMPRAVTVKAYGTQTGKKAGFQGSATYSLPEQAATPTISLQQKFVLGWCNATSVSTNTSAPPHIQPGSCSALHSNGTECNAALAVPCTSFGRVCSSGSLGRTVASDGVYDGSILSGGASTLSQDYGAGQSELFVASLAALGFVNDGALPSPRTLRVGGNGEDGSGFPALSVTAVDQAASSLTVTIDLTTSYAALGSQVSLLDACVVGDVTRSVTVQLQTATAGTQLYYTINASTPSAASFVLAGPGALAFALPANLTVVAAGSGYINSFPLEVGFADPCGDGTVEGGEQCDDGGREDGDGCSADCLIE